MPTIDADQIDLAVCEDCEKIPVVALGWVGSEPVLVISCNCTDSVITTNLGIEETPDCWK